MDPKLLDIICCPVFREKLSFVTPKELQVINTAIGSKTIKKLGGSVAKDIVTNALINSSKTLLYPIEDDIPVLLDDAAIELKEIDI
jgi:uncharacterized protein YbaR (Trm112 family)